MPINNLFADETQKSASEKFYMIKIEGLLALNYSSTIIQTDGARNLYEQQLPTNLYIESLYRNTSTTTQNAFYIRPDRQVTIDDTTNQASYDQQTGKLRWVTSLEPGVDFPFILTFALYFTNGVTRYHDRDMLQSHQKVEWQGRVIGNPRFGYNQENSIAGILSISSSDIVLANADGYVSQFLSPEYGFNNQKVTIWRCIANAYNYELAFTGTIKSASVSNGQVSFGVNDILSTFDKEFTGIPGNYVYQWRTFLGSHTVRTDDYYKLIPVQFGRLSPFKLKLTTTGQALKIYIADPEGMTKATCVDYTQTKGTATNRTWSCGLSGATPFADALDKGFSQASAPLIRMIDTYSSTILTPMLPEGKNCHDYYAVGDTVTVGTHHSLLVGVGDDTIEIWPQNASITQAMVIVRKKVPCVVIRKGGVDYYPRAGRDYNCQLDPNGRGDLQIKFINAAETAIGGIGTIDPDNCEVFFRYWHDDETQYTKASDITRWIIMNSGVQVSGWFVPYQSNPEYTYYDPDLSLMIPFANGDQYPTVREVVELCIRSFFGFIYFDNEGYCRMKSFLDPMKAADDIVNESYFDPQTALDKNTSSGLSYEIDFHDCYTGIICDSETHPNYSNGQVIGETTTSKKLNNSLKRYIHNNCINFVSFRYGEEFYNQMAAFLLARRVTYSLKAFSPHFTMWLGDDVLVKKDVAIMGEQKEKYMRVIGLDKTDLEVDVKLIDCDKFPHYP